MKRTIISAVLTVLLLLTWFGASKIYEYLIPWRWLETLLILATLILLVWVFMTIANKVDKKLKNK